MNEQNMLQVSSSPHIHSNASTTKIMLDVIIALLPAAVMSAVIFGTRSLLVIAVSVASCVVFEFLWSVIMKKPLPLGDLTAVVTGLLLAFNLPVSIPLWQVTVGAFVAIVIVKQLFGGLGCNFVNPALAGRVVMALSFPSSMTAYGFPAGEAAVLIDSAATATPDAAAAATPLATIAAGEGGTLDLLKLFLGQNGGVLGETCVVALVAGGVYLMIKGVIKPIIPLAFVGTVFGMTALVGSYPVASILSGGLMLGAIFMATDYVTSPYTNWGKLIFGIGCGLITVVIRVFGTLTEGVSFAILLMNLIVPYINDLCRHRPFGGKAK